MKEITEGHKNEIEEKNENDEKERDNLTQKLINTLNLKQSIN